MSTGWQEGYVAVGGVRLHYHRTGGDKPAVVLAHGITDNGLCWTRLAHALQASYDLILYDARGHGMSDHPGSYKLADHVADLVGLIQALDLKSPFLFGHSMGGTHSAFAAARYPDLPRGLLLEDPHWPAEPEDAATYDLETWRNNLATDKAKPVETLLRSGRANNPAWDAGELRPWAEAKRQVDPDVVTWLNSHDEINGWREVVKQIRCPTLLITGDTEVTVMPDVAKEAAQLCPSVTIVQIPNAGHSIRRDRFTVYVEVVKAFLDGVVTSLMDEHRG